MQITHDVPENLLTGRRAVDGLTGIDLLEDWEWNNDKSRWVLKCALKIDSDHPHMPSKTVWYVIADPIYPEGNIDFYPSKLDGLTTTFQHQNNNSLGDPGLPWRTGDICLHSEFHHIGQFSITDEPMGDPHLRLRWRFQRALAWLTAAAKDELVKPGDPFELPHVPISPQFDRTILFIEDPVSFAALEKIDTSMGIVDFVSLKQQKDVVFPTSFLSKAGKQIFQPAWGQCIASKTDRSFQGLWLLLKEPPVLPVWHIPNTWKELKAVFNHQGVCIADCIKPIKKELKRNSVVLLLGFPIMERIGNSFSQIHWLAIQLTTSATRIKKNKIKSNYAKKYEKSYMKDDDDVPWLNTENCHYSRVSVRGKLNKDFRENEVLLIGQGAIGSVIAEQMARAGHPKIGLMDQDILVAGNLVRHTLGLESLTRRKSVAINDRLSLLSPHIDVDVINESFPPANLENIDKIRKYSIVIDCTADRKLRHQLSAFNWEQERLFITIALGFRAKRLYFYSAIDVSFPVAAFDGLISEWLEKERPEYIGEGFPREGIGCWHPIFPARVDDIWMLSSAAMKQLEQTVLSPPETPQLVVFEQIFDNGVFNGIRKITNEKK